MLDRTALRVVYEPARPGTVPRPGTVRPGSAASYRPGSAATGSDLKPSSPLTRPMSAPPVREDVRPGWRSGKSHAHSPVQGDAIRQRNLRKDFYVQEQIRLRQQSLLEAQRAGVLRRSPSTSASGRRQQGSPPRVALHTPVHNVLDDLSAVQHRVDELRVENATQRAQLAQLTRRSQRVDSLEAEVENLRERVATEEMWRKKAEALARKKKAETQAAREALAIVAEPWPALGRSLGQGPWPGALATAAAAEAPASAAEALVEQSPDVNEDSWSFGPLQQRELRSANQLLKRQLTVANQELLSLRLRLDGEPQQPPQQQPQSQVRGTLVGAGGVASNSRPEQVDSRRPVPEVDIVGGVVIIRAAVPATTEEQRVAAADPTPDEPTAAGSENSRLRGAASKVIRSTRVNALAAAEAAEAEARQAKLAAAAVAAEAVEAAKAAAEAAEAAAKAAKAAEAEARQAKLAAAAVRLQARQRGRLARKLHLSMQAKAKVRQVRTASRFVRNLSMEAEAQKAWLARARARRQTLRPATAERTPAEWLAAWPGGDLDALDGEGWSALQRAAQAGEAMAMIELLRRPQVEVNAVEPKKGQTALVLASRGGHAAVVKTLLACKEVEVNKADLNGYTALHIAAEKGKPAVVQLLLAHTAVDPNQADQAGHTPLFSAAYVGNDVIVQLLLSREDLDVNRAGQALGRTPLYIAAQFGNDEVVRLLLAHPAAEVDQPSLKGATPLLVACLANSTAAALALLGATADPNREWALESGVYTPLTIAHQADNTELLAALVAAGADVTVLYAPLVAECMLGHAHAARRLLLETRQAASPTSSAEADDLPPLILACLRGDAAALLKNDGSDDACEAYASGLPPAFYFAAELGDTTVVAAALTGAQSLNEQQIDVLCAQVSLAAKKYDADAGNYVPGACPLLPTATSASMPTTRHFASSRPPTPFAGTRYQATLLALAREGLIDVAMCGAVKSLFAGYLGSVASAAHLTDVPSAFDELKGVMESRLKVIAVPLEDLYAEERLAERLGALGEATHGAKVTLEDDGLLPLPKFVHGCPNPNPKLNPNPNPNPNPSPNPSPSP